MVQITKYVLILMIAFTASSSAFADADTIKICVDMLNQRQAQANVTNKINNKQANTYCACTIPKLEQIKTGTTPTQQELTDLYTECMEEAGIELKK